MDRAVLRLGRDPGRFVEPHVGVRTEPRRRRRTRRACPRRLSPGLGAVSAAGWGVAPAPALRAGRDLDRGLRSPRSRAASGPTSPGRFRAPRGWRTRDLVCRSRISSPCLGRRKPSAQAELRMALDGARVGVSSVEHHRRPLRNRGVLRRSADRRRPAALAPGLALARRSRRRRWRGSSASKGRSRPSLGVLLGRARHRAGTARGAPGRRVDLAAGGVASLASPPTPDSTRCERWRKGRAGRFEPIGPECRSARGRPPWCSSRSIPDARATRRAAG